MLTQPIELFKKDHETIRRSIYTISVRPFLTPENRTDFIKSANRLMILVLCYSLNRCYNQAHDFISKVPLFSVYINPSKANASSKIMKWIFCCVFYDVSQAYMTSPWLLNASNASAWQRVKSADFVGTMRISHICYLYCLQVEKYIVIKSIQTIYTLWKRVVIPPFEAFPSKNRPILPWPDFHSNAKCDHWSPKRRLGSYFPKSAFALWQVSINNYIFLNSHWLF